MNAIVVATLLALAPPATAPSTAHAPTKKTTASTTSPPASTVLQQIGDGDPVFTRDEPALAAARRALDAEDADLAVDRAREAVSASADERAVVEYDAAQALRARARKEVEAQQQAAPQAGPSSSGGPPAPPPRPNLDDAIASFDRAAALAVSPRLQSEARLGAGNAALEAGKLEDAIAALRKAVIADPTNERARRNLQRALDLKKAQPPPPPQEGGDKNDDQKNDEKKDDKKDQQDQQKQDQQDQNDQQKQDQQGQNDPQKQDQQKRDEQGQNDQQKQDQQKQDQKKSDGDQQGQNGAEAKPDEQKGGQGADAAKPKKTSKDEKRRLLQGLRSRERPLTPLEMRGVEKKRAPGGKDW
jgi:tetratricopeptide (TPR) repeat protein